MTTVSFFYFSSRRNRFWALSQMGLAPRRVAGTPGLQFFKFLGSGAANGFGLKPNFSVYGFLGVWEDEAAFRHFQEHHPVAVAYRERSDRSQTVFLKPVMAHGLWDGQNPFVPTAGFDPQAPVAVLTRATIRLRHLWRFWQFVGPVSADTAQRPGLRFAVGIGEVPLIQQATFSLWDSGRQMLDYAYRREKHAEVIRKTRELGWYREELFARFLPCRVEGGGFFEFTAEKMKNNPD
ncbi:MAG: hypothetical protein SFV52_04745 [Saprospiraceae bacterium]|nr:hypothetical protein [Saprospiraceae bacterium]